MPPADAGPDLDATADARTDAAPDATLPLEQLSGRLQILGCTTEASALRVELAAVELHAAGDTGSVLEPIPEPGEPVDPPVIEVELRAGAEPGEYRFVASDIPRGVYRLGAVVDAAGCEDLVWRGPTDGLVFTGSDDIELTAVALRTHLEVYDESTELWSSAAWASVTDTTRRFRVRSDLPDLVAVDIQISTERFSVEDPRDDGFCEPPAGAQTQAMEVPPGGRELNIDISDWINPPSGGSLEEERQYQRILMGAPIYLRAIPRTSAGSLCRVPELGASSWVRLVRRDFTFPAPAPQPAVRVTGSAASAWYPHRSIVEHGHACYRMTVDHRMSASNFYTDPMAFMLINKGIYNNNELARAGDRFCLAPSSGGGGIVSDITGAFGDMVGAMVSAVEWAVNRAAALYEDIKRYAISMVANAIADLTGCEAPCRSALEFGTELAMASMGLPPSLPDFDALVDQGFDYMVAEIATQTGLPEVVVEQAAELVTEMIEHANASRGMAHIPWMMRDSGFVPTVMTLDLVRAPTTLPGARWMWLFPGPPNDVWQPRLVSLPTGSPHRVPVVLEGNYDGLPPLEPLIVWMGAPLYGSSQRQEAWFQTKWGERRASYGCSHFDAWLGDPDPRDRVASFDLAAAALATFSDPYESQCTP